MVSDRVDELFPRTFSYESGGAATTLPLFGDLVEAVTRLVDSESAGDAPPDLVPATGAEIWSLGEIQFGPRNIHVVAAPPPRPASRE